MRTTLNIGDDVLQAARQLAHEKGQSLGGRTLLELARASLTRHRVSQYRNGVKLLPVGPAAPRSTMWEVNALRDELERAGSSSTSAF